MMSKTFFPKFMKPDCAALRPCCGHTLRLMPPRPLLLLHGNGETHAIFDRAMPLLAERFTVYALDIDKLPLSGKFGGPEVKAAMQGHILAEAKITGTYTLNPALL